MLRILRMKKIKIYIERTFAFMNVKRVFTLCMALAVALCMTAVPALAETPQDGAGVEPEAVFVEKTVAEEPADLLPEEAEEPEAALLSEPGEDVEAEVQDDAPQNFVVQDTDEFRSAVGNAKDGDIITLAGDIDFGNGAIGMTIRKTLTIDLNGHTVTNGQRVFTVNGGHLTLTGEGTLSEKNPYFAPILVCGSTDPSDVNYSSVTVGPDVTLSGWTGIFVDQTSGDAYGVQIDMYGTAIGNTDSGGNSGAAIYINGQIQDKENCPVINIYDGAVLTGASCAVYAAGYAQWNISGGSFTGTEALSLKSGEWNISGGTFAATGEFVDPAEANGNGSEETGAAVGITSTYNHLSNGEIVMNISGGTFESVNGCGLYAGHSVSGNTPIAYTTGLDIQISGGTFTNGIGEGSAALYIADSIEGDVLSYAVTGGTYATSVSQYLNDGYAGILNQDGYYDVVKSAVKVIETVQGPNYTVTLDNLADSVNFDPQESAVYQVVLSEASAADRAAAEEAAAADTNTNREIVDIQVVKTNASGSSEVVSVTDQPVTLRLQNPVAEGNTPRVYHVEDSGAAVEVKPVTLLDDRQTITFTAPSFSAYLVTYDQDDLPADYITGTVTVSLAETGADGVYDIVLSAEEGKYINRFFSTELGFALTKDGGDAVGALSLTPGTNMILTAGDTAGRYMFSMNGSTAYAVTGNQIAIGQARIAGYGTYTLSLVNTAENLVNTATAADNIVQTYVGQDTLRIDVDNGSKTVTLAPPTTSLTVNVMFPNAVTAREAGYTKMDVSITGGGENITYALGTDTDGVTEETFSSGYSGYSFKVDLPRNQRYTLTFKGDGYRPYSVTTTPSDATESVTVWNNALDEAAAVVVKGDGTAAKTADVTFLAGDIVADGRINLYDLSAVVSYFGQVDITDDRYIAYDLNRDGKIDSRDVAMVLVSWGK